MNTFALTITTLASSGDEEANPLAVAGVFLFLSVVFGLITYVLVIKATKNKYRNANKRYLFESTTSSSVDNYQMWDDFMEERKALKMPRVKGDNSRSPEKRAKKAAVYEMPPEEDKAQTPVQEDVW